MKGEIVIVIFILSGLVLLSATEQGYLPGRGFNNNIAWMKLNAGLSRAKREDLPVMMLIHKSWCGACKALKPKFAESKEIEELSEQFVMINIQDEEEPSREEKYHPDGAYIPRILFLDSLANLMEDVHNEDLSSTQHKFFYSNAPSIVASMRRVLDRVHPVRASSDEL